MVCLPVTDVSRVKRAEPTVMLFGTWTRVYPRNHLLDRDTDPRCKGKILKGKGASLGHVHSQSDSAGERTGKVWMPIGVYKTGVQIGATWRIQQNRLCTTATWPYVK